jgi:hypothetical protein
MYFTCPKEEIEKNKISSHKLPKQQSTNFWSQGILGIKRDFQKIKITKKTI